MKLINNELIRSFSPCYDPSVKGIPDSESLPVLEWVEKYRGVVPAEDILWLLLRNEFLSDKDLRIFAVWCAREALKLVDNPDPRSIEACNVAERYANGEATDEELSSAEAVAWATAAAAAAAGAAAGAAARAAAWATVGEGATAAAAARDATWAAAGAAWETVNKRVREVAVAGNTRNLQLNYLLTYFK